MHQGSKLVESGIQNSGLASLILFLIRRRFIWLGTVLAFIAFSGMQIIIAPKAAATYKVSARLVSSAIPEPLKSSISVNLDQLILLGSNEPAVLESAFKNSGLAESIPGLKNPEKTREYLLDAFIGKKLVSSIDSLNPGGILFSVTSGNPDAGRKFIDEAIINLDGFLRNAVASKAVIIKEAIDVSVAGFTARGSGDSIEKLKSESYQAKLYAERRIPLINSYSMPTIQIGMASWKRTILKSMIAGLLVGLFFAFMADSYTAIVKLLRVRNELEKQDENRTDEK